MEEVRTTKNGLQYRRDWDNDGGIVMLNDKTVGRYKELKYDFNPNYDVLDCFFAFTKEDFNAKKQSLIKRGALKEGEKLVSAGYGLYGTAKGIDTLQELYNGKDRQIAKECYPQEVYFFEYNNHECMYDYDGDEPAIRIIISIWGKECAKTIDRIDGFKSIDLINE